MSWTSVLSDLLVATAVLSVLPRHTRPSVVALALQGLVLAAVAVVYNPGTTGVLTASLVLIAKTIVVPGLLYRTADHVAAFELSEPSSAWSYLGIVGVLVAVRALEPSVAVGVFSSTTTQLVTASLAVTMLGLLGVATRRILPNQILGLATTENGLYGAGLVLAHGLPFILDLGVVVDLVLALFLLAWLTGRIRDVSGHVDADQLNGLRG